MPQHAGVAGTREVAVVLVDAELDAFIVDLETQNKIYRYIIFMPR